MDFIEIRTVMGAPNSYCYFVVRVWLKKEIPLWSGKPVVGRVTLRRYGISTDVDALLMYAAPQGGKEIRVFKFLTQIARIVKVG